MIQNFNVFKDNDNGGYQIRTKGNCYFIEFDDNVREAIFEQAVAIIQKDSTIALPAIINKLKQHPENIVLDVLHELNNIELIPYELTKDLNEQKGKPATATNHYAQNATYKTLSDVKVVIFSASGALCDKLQATGKSMGFLQVDTKLFDSIANDNVVNTIIANNDFFIVDASQWNPYFVELINRVALQHNKPWLFIGGIEEGSLKVGPLFYGKETGCYHCLMSRIKSNHEHAKFLTSYEHYLRQNHQSAKPDTLPHETLYYDWIASLVFIETTKFVEQWSLPVLWKSYISFNTFSYEVTKHHLLKAPFCEVCKPELAYNPSPWLEAVTLK